MNETIEALLATARPEFRPWMHYHEEADSLEIHVAPGEVNRCRVDGVMTVYETLDGQFGGCLLKGITKLLTKASGKIGFTVSNGKVKVRLLVLAYVAQHPEVLDTRGASIAKVLSAEVAETELELIS